MKPWMAFAPLSLLVTAPAWALDPAGVTLETSAQGRAILPNGSSIPVSTADHRFTVGVSQAEIGGSLAYARGGFDPYPAILAYTSASIGGAATAGGAAAYSFRYATYDGGAALALRGALDIAIFAGGSPVRVSGVAQLSATDTVDSQGAVASASATVQAARGGEGYFSSTCAYGFGCGTFNFNLGASLAYAETDGLFTFDGIVSVRADAGSRDGYTAFAFADPEIAFSQSFLDAHPGIAGLFTLSLSDGVVNASGPVPVWPPVVTDVPEPSAWAMMIGGFGFVGGSMRLRRRRDVRAA